MTWGVDFEFAAGVGGCSGQGERAGGFAASDFDGAAGIGVEAAGEGEDLIEGFRAADLVDAGGADGAEDGDGLATKFGDEDGDGGVLEDDGEFGDELGFKLFDGEAGGVEAADDGEVDVAGHIDAEGLIGDLVDIEDADEDLVVGTEDIAGGRGLAPEGGSAGEGEGEGEERGGDPGEGDGAGGRGGGHGFRGAKNS